MERTQSNGDNDDDKADVEPEPEIEDDLHRLDIERPR
jgi:hypothetical protein